MSLAKLFESKFRGDIRHRGQAYLVEERVGITRVTPDNLYAVVRVGDEFETQLSRHDGDLRMFCSCFADNPKANQACKHLWATLLAVDAGDYLTGAVRPGHIPPFAAEIEAPVYSRDWDDLEEDELAAEQAMLRPSRSASGARAVLEAEPKLSEWQGRLRDLRRQMTDNGGSAATERDREIFYEIDLPASRECGQLVVQTSQRQRRVNGQWGKLKPLKLRTNQLDEIEHVDDRRTLAYLSGSIPERNSWYAQQAESQTAVFRYRVPYELCELILPLMCRTGRVRLLDGEERFGEALSWDDGAPWSLCMAVTYDEDESQWFVQGQIRRDDDVIPVDELEVLIPGGLVITREWIGRLDDFGAAEWVRFFSERGQLSVDEGEEQHLVDQLLDMPTLPQLELPEELQLEEVRTQPIPCLTIRSPKAKGWKYERLRGNVEFDYLGEKISASSTQWAIVQRDQGRCIVRDRDFEASAWNRLQDLGLRRTVDRVRSGHDVDVAASDLGPAVRSLIAEGWQVQADGKQVRQPANLKFRIESGIDWFELSADVNFEGRTIAFPELLSALSRGDTTVRLDDGSLGILPEEWLEQFGLLGRLGRLEEDHVRFSATQVGLLDALLATQESVEADDRFIEIRERLQHFEGVAKAQEPEGFAGTLRGYQNEGLGWLRFLEDFNFGGCLADDMGLGKTVQVLALFLSRKQRREGFLPSLVVVPKSLLFNWLSEIRRFTPQLSVLEYTGTDRTQVRDDIARHDLIITTYGTLRRDIAFLREMQFDYAVLDEAQTIKNAGSQVAKASRLVRANHRLALSGTPIENHLGDLWSIFEFLNPNMLGRSSVFKLYTNDIANDQARGILASGLRPFVLRRTKQQVAADLPDKFEETIFCEMEPEQRRLYDELRSHYRDSLLGLVRDQGLGKTRMHVLEALLRLRQSACHPALLDRGKSSDSAAKLDVLCPHLEELIAEDHKSLVFSQFTSLLGIVREHLDKRGIKYCYLDGQTRKRKQVVEKFQKDPDVGVFLISLKAGGLGLNLTAAEYVFLLDPWWNPAVEAQAIDRAHRVGQTRQVFAYRLICRDTVEEKILELQSKKRELADAILQADEKSPLSELTTDDLEMLLS